MRIIIISINNWALSYLKESFNKDLLKKVTLVTDKLTDELRNFLNENKINYVVTKNLTFNKIKKFDIKKSIIISAGSPWIFDKSIIKKFGNNFFNIHQSPLPSMRGSVAPYIILYDIRSFQVCIHKVTTTIDTGNIIYRKNILIPSQLRSPHEVNNFLQKKNREMLKEFLIKLVNKQKIKSEKQNKFFSSYNVRLFNEVNGWIDWSYNVDDLDRFIRSFGHPYGGAKTFIHDKQVSIKYIEKSKQDAARHPDEIGRVIRKFENSIIVSVKEGSIYIWEVLWKKKNIINKIKSGDKFFTKIKFLDLKNRRVNFIKKNKRIYNQQVTLIKR